MKVRLLYIFLFIIQILPLLSFAQVDDDFWFVVPELTQKHATNLGEPTYFRISSVGDTVRVKIEMPARGVTLADILLPAGEYTYYDITPLIRDNYDPADPTSGDPNDNNTIESGLPGTEGIISDRGIHIYSRGINENNRNSNVTVYCDRFNTNNKDIWSLKGRNGLGTNFTVPSQNYAPNVSIGPPYALNAFDIVATADATTVYITPKQRIKHVGFSPNYYEKDVTFSITLNKGETFSCVAMSRSIAAHIGGSIVTSNNPIAITMKDDSMRPNDDGGYDVAGDQLIPDTLAGLEYIVMRGELTEEEYVFVMATKDGTTTVDYTGPGTLTLNGRGDIDKIRLNAAGNIIDALHITADQKILVWHVTGFGYEVGGSVVPSIDLCTGSKDVTVVRSSSTQDFFLSLMTRTPYKDDFTIYIDVNGNGTYGLGEAFPMDQSWFQQVPGTDWWYLTKANNEFTDNTSPIGQGIIANRPTRITNSGRFHLGIIEGLASGGCKNGYFSSFSADTGSASIGIEAKGIERYCYGDVIELKASGAVAYEWWYDGTVPAYNTFLTATNIAAPLAKLTPATSIWEPYKVRIEKDCYTPGFQFDTLVVEVQVYEEIKAVFDTVPLSPNCCSPVSYLVNNTPQNKTIYEWNIPKENDTVDFIGIQYNDTILLENHSYSPKAYNLQLVANKNYLCYDTLTIPVTVNPMITAKIAKGAPEGCQQDIIGKYLVDTASAGPFTDAIWDWGDGTQILNVLHDDAADTIYHTFQNLNEYDTTYYVILTLVDSAGGCSNSVADSVFVPGIARARFSASNKVGCSPLTVEIENNSNGDILYEWSFYDGNIGSPTVNATSNFTDTTITYTNTTASPVQYYLYLKIIKLNDDGSFCEDWTPIDTVIVYPEFTTTISPAGPIEGCNPLSVDFSQTTIPNVATQFFWNFGNGATSGLADPTPKQFAHTQNSDQNYTVSLIAKSAFNCVDTAPSVSVTSYAFVDALFSVDDTLGCSPFEVNVANISSPNSYQDFTWTIPDNIGDAPNNLAPFMVRYENLGILPVQKTITLQNQNTHAGCDVSYAKVITVNPEISAQFSRPANTDTVCNNTSITFTNESFFTGAPATKITAATANKSFLWSFGDGTTSSSENPSKLFKNTSGSTGTTPQKFLITLTLTVNGCTEIYTDSVYVKPPVKAQFNTPQTSLCNNATITLANTSVGANNYLWQFNDGTPSVSKTDLTPVSFLAVNTVANLNDIQYTKVYLTANNGNCTHTDSLTLLVYPEVVPQIIPDATSLCAPDSVAFTNLTTGGNSTDNPLTYLWDFNDGQTSSSSANPLKHRFENTTTGDLIRTVKLTATNSIGCSNFTTQNVTVFPQVDARFTFIKNSECHPVNVFLDNNSLNGTLYKWDFGFNGETLDTVALDFYKVFEHTHADPNIASNYTIQMIAFDANHPQCSDTASRPITIYPPVISQFVVSDNDTVCYPEITEFTNSSTGYDLSYIWDYRDGNTSAATDAVHTHLFENRTPSDITYSVKLTVIDGNGCPATSTKNVVAHPRVIAGFTFQKDALDKCTPIPVQFTYPSSALNGNQFVWNFGDGSINQTFTNKNAFTHIFDNVNPNTPVNYTIHLTANDVNTGCSHDTTRTIRIFPRLKPKFTPNGLEGCNPLTVRFTNQTTGMASYSWDFADNQTSIETNPRHTFVNLKLSDQDYNVVLTANQDSTGCVLTADTLITVYSNVDAVFGLQAADQQGEKGGSKAAIVGGCTAFDVVVTDSSKVNGSKLWNFGALFNIPDSSDSQFELTYLNNDNIAPLDDTTYTIKLVLANTHGCKDSMQQDLVVYPRPVANFTGDLEGCNPLKVDIVNQSEANDQYSYFWEISDGSTIVSENFSHMFYNYNNYDTKTYTIKLTASSENLCSASFTDEVTVYPKPLSVIIPQTDRDCSPFNVVLENDSRGTQLRYFWNFDDGTGEHLVNSDVDQQVAYVNTGALKKIYTVSLRSVTEFNCSDTVEQPITVYPEVRAKFTPDLTEGCSPVEINFTNKSEPNSSDGATVFRWDFGDGVFSENKQVSHRYVNETGADKTYVITLYAASVHGCDSTITDTVAIYISPNAEFSIKDPIKQYPDTVFQFLNLAKTGPWDYLWDFGDGHTSTETTRDWFTHVYEGWGPKTNGFVDTVHLTVYSDHCMDDSYQLITRRPPLPSISIRNEDVRGCVPLGVDFQVATEYGYEESIEWSFGDGETTLEPEPYHEYDTAGVFFVRVEIRGDGGLFIDTAFVEVYPLPVPQFSITPTYVMLPDQQVQFYNTSFINLSNSSLDYLWEFGDGQTSIEKHPVHLYATQNLDGYPIKLIVTSDKGCVDSLTHETRVIVDGSGQIIFPNAFLPVDGKFDGSYGGMSNDVFRPVHYGVQEYELWIFNRWGEQIFYSDDVLVGWNGRYGNDGDLLEQDVYFWKSKGKFNNGVPFKKAGDVTLIRK